MFSYKKDGVTCIVIPVEGISDEAILAKDIPEGAENVRKITADDLPKNRVFRNAWDCDSKSLFVDMVKGKNIAHEIRREKRTKAFAPNLDVIDRASKGIPLKSSESDSGAKSANASIKSDDDALQIQIDSATSEEDLLNAIK